MSSQPFPDLGPPTLKWMNQQITKAFKIHSLTFIQKSVFKEIYLLNYLSNICQNPRIMGTGLPEWVTLKKRQQLKDRQRVKTK